MDTQELHAIVRTASNPDGQLILAMLKKRLDERNETLRKVDAPEVHRYQGRALELAELIRDFETARETLGKMLVPAPKITKRM